MAVENRKSKFLLPVWLDLRLGGVFCEQPETMYLQLTDMTNKTKKPKVIETLKSKEICILELLCKNKTNQKIISFKL